MADSVSGPEWPESQEWYTISEVADLFGLSISKVRRLVEDHLLASVAVGGTQRIPVEFISGNEPLTELRGTLILLGDSGFTREQSVRWLIEVDDVLGARPIDALLAGRKAEVRRVAQAYSF